jgi:Asp/Glu/hydantoin racemase
MITAPVKIGMLHTVASNAAVIGPLVAAEVAPALGLSPADVDVLHMVDENLLRDTIDHGLLPRTVRRVATLVAFAEESGARAVLVTCSSIGAAVEAARPMVGVPVLRIDAPMADEAVRAAGPGGRIGVAATLSSTLGPTAELIRRTAAGSGADVRVEDAVADGAFAALKAGDTASHDRLVAETVRDLAGRSEVVVLAQASMARAVSGGSDVGVPVLTSTISGVRQLVDALRSSRV